MVVPCPECALEGHSEDCDWCEGWGAIKLQRAVRTDDGGVFEVYCSSEITDDEDTV